MTRENREVWAKRVERLGDSGLTAKEFAAEIGVNANTLAGWRWRLGSRGSGDEPCRRQVRKGPAVLGIVAAAGGSISAEHGIGRAKLDWLPLTRSAADVAAMAALKRAWDPSGLLAPGVLFPAGAVSLDRPF